MPTYDSTIEINGTEYEIEVGYDYTPGRRASGPRGEPPLDPPEPETVEINNISIRYPPPPFCVHVPYLLYKVLGIDQDALRDKICEHEFEKSQEAADHCGGDGKED